MLQLRHKNNEKPPIWLVDPQYSIGSAASNTIQASGAGVRALHVKIEVANDEISLHNLVGDGLVRVNGIPVTDRKSLVHGDEIVVGGTALSVQDPKIADANLHSEDVTSARIMELPWTLVAKNSALKGRSYSVSGDVVIGRSKECDISLGITHLSRKHAKLTHTPQGLTVEDLNSSNGTYVNGQKVQSAILHPGDELGFDTLKFKLVGPEGDDDDKTTIRPVVKVPGEAVAAAPAQPQQHSQPVSRPATAKPKPQGAIAKQQTATPKAVQMEAPESSSKGVVVGALIIALVIAIATWVILGQ